MKYIRTEKGIYEVTTPLIDKNESFYRTLKGENIFKGKVLEEADTIEELCDVYVSVYEEQLDNEIFWANKYTPKEVYHFYPSYTPKEVYGAIWTGKGLIYVAKMNEKGELVLI